MACQAVEGTRYVDNPLFTWRDLADETVTTAVHRLDVPRTASIVAECVAHFLDTSHQRRIANSDIGPQRAKRSSLAMTSPRRSAMNERSARALGVRGALGHRHTSVRREAQDDSVRT